MAAGTGVRDLLLIGGDLHFGMGSDILLQRIPVVRQLITTAIANKPPPWCGYCLLRCLLSCTALCCPTLGSGGAGGNTSSYTVQHHSFLHARNFALVDLSVKNGRGRIQSALISATTPLPVDSQV